MKCKKCKNNHMKYEFTTSKIVCEFCGVCIEDFICNPDILFEKNKSTKCLKSGHLIKNTDLIKSKISVKSLYFNAKRKIRQLGDILKLDLNFQDSAFRLFIFASSKGITIGQTQAICACCVYVICRYKKTSYLLVDFSDIIQVCSNKLGTIFMKFIRNLNISLPIVDPSFFIYRFAINLNFGNKTNAILKTALRLIARMKRDWLSTGRKPSGLCGAALLMSSCIHGLKRSQREISETVKIGKMILQSRLREIDKTGIGDLTIHQINRGGGGDGKKESLSDNFSFVFSLPPSIKKTKLYSEISVKKISSLYKQVKRSRKIFCNTNENKNNKDKQNALNYLNTNLEVYIKKDLWAMSNLGLVCSHTIIIRAQKEKPFAFFKIKKKLFPTNPQ